MKTRWHLVILIGAAGLVTGCGSEGGASEDQGQEQRAGSVFGNSAPAPVLKNCSNYYLNVCPKTRDKDKCQSKYDAAETERQGGAAGEALEGECLEAWWSDTANRSSYPYPPSVCNPTDLVVYDKDKITILWGHPYYYRALEGTKSDVGMVASDQASQTNPRVYGGSWEKLEIVSSNLKESCTEPNVSDLLADEDSEEDEPVDNDNCEDLSYSEIDLLSHVETIAQTEGAHCHDHQKLVLVAK